MEDLLQYSDFSEVDSVTAKLAGTDTVSFSALFGLFIKGDFTGAYKLLMQELGQLFFPGITAFREILLAILGIGMVAMLLHYLAGFVKNKQVADMTAYFIYLLMMILLFRYVTTMLSISKQNLENLREFMSVLVPGYFLSVTCRRQCGSGCELPVFSAAFNGSGLYFTESAASLQQRLYLSGCYEWD